MQGSRNEVMISCDISKKREVGGLRSSLEVRTGRTKKAALPVQEAARSHVVGANVLQVVELQLQLTYSHVLGGQLLLQPPQLILLPEEHPQELRGEKQQLTHFNNLFLIK